MKCRVINHKRPYTPEDDALLLRLRRKGVPCAVIADRMGRSRGAVYQRIARLGGIGKVGVGVGDKRDVAPAVELFEYLLGMALKKRDKGELKASDREIITEIIFGIHSHNRCVQAQEVKRAESGDAK